MNSQHDQYRRVEARRRMIVWFMSAFVMVVGVSFSLRFQWPTNVVIIVVLAVVVGALMLSMVRYRTAAAIEVHTVPKSGSWPAGIPLIFFSGRTESDESARVPILMGRITFAPDAITWVPGSLAERTAHVSPVRWEPSCHFSARRLPGIGGQLQLNIDGSAEHPPVALRLWRTGGFPLPSSSQ